VWHTDLYPKYPMAFSFSTGSIPNGATPLMELPAESFVPNLVAKYIFHSSRSQNSELRERESEIFDVLYWEFGPK
jgi:hypothetical protein